MTDKNNESRTNSLDNLIAAGFGRMVQHLRSGPFAIISAEADGQKGTPEGHKINKDRSQQLRELLRTYGLGFVQVDGSWASGEVGEYLSEKSVLIPKMSFKDATAVSQQFQQEAFVWGENGTYGVYTTGSATPFFGRKRRRTFSTVERRAGSWRWLYRIQRSQMAV